MGLRVPRRHELIPDLLRERDIDQVIPVDVADLTPSKAVLDPPEPMWMRLDLWSGKHCLPDLLGRAQMPGGVLF